MIVHSVETEKVEGVLPLYDKSGLLVGIGLCGVVVLIGLVLDLRDLSVDRQGFGSGIQVGVGMPAGKIAFEAPPVSQVAFDLSDLFIAQDIIEDDQFTQFAAPITVVDVSVVGKGICRDVAGRPQ